MSALSNPKIDALENLEVGTFLYRRIARGAVTWNFETEKFQVSVPFEPPAVAQQGGSMSCHRKDLIDTACGDYSKAFSPPLAGGHAMCFPLTLSISTFYRAKAHPLGKVYPLDIAHAGIFSKTEKRLTEEELQTLAVYINQSEISYLFESGFRNVQDPPSEDTFVVVEGTKN